MIRETAEIEKKEEKEEVIAMTSLQETITQKEMSQVEDILPKVALLEQWARTMMQIQEASKEMITKIQFL
jgi:citrate lyase synthetase